MGFHKYESQWTGEDLKAWSQACGFENFKEAGRALSVSYTNLYRYANGDTPIPRSLELACRFVASHLGVTLPRSLSKITPPEAA